MKRKVRRISLVVMVLGCGVLAWLYGGQPRETTSRLLWPSVALSSRDRILILAPHPDDEVLGCAGIIQEAVAKGLPLRIVFFTNGDNNQWSFLMYRKHPIFAPSAVRNMGVVRVKEALAASKILGLAPEQLTFLGYPDFGTLHIWHKHWGDRSPFQSMLTRVTAVPYTNAMRPGAPYKGEEVLRDLTTVLREFRPTKIFVSHPADRNPDHLALYLFTRVALWDLAHEMTPELYPYLIHLNRWPLPRGYHPTRSLTPPTLFREQIPWQVSHLSPRQVERKYSAIQAHQTQYAYSKRYLRSFIRPNELFGDFPTVALRPTEIPLPLSPDRAEELQETPEELTDEERAVFVGVEARSVRLEHDHLVLSLEFSRPLAETVGASVYIFGYREDRPFTEMPKVHVQFGLFAYQIYDQERRLPPETLQVIRQARTLTIRVPLHVLGDPQRILTSARTFLGDVPLDWISWRVLELSTTSSQ